MLLLSCHPVLLLNSQLKREGRKASSGFSKDSEHDAAGVRMRWKPIE